MRDGTYRQTDILEMIAGGRPARERRQQSVRETSIEAYRTIESEGLLSSMRWRVYDLLFKYGPATACELAQHCEPSKSTRGFAGNMHARLGELRDLSVAREVRERICGVTKRVVIEWDVTSRLPDKSGLHKKASDDREPVSRDAWDQLCADHRLLAQEYKTCREDRDALLVEVERLRSTP